MPRGCAVLGIVLKVELELREEDDVNMPKEKHVVTLPLHFCDGYFLLDEINTRPSSYNRTRKNRIHKKKNKDKCFYTSTKQLKERN